MADTDDLSSAAARASRKVEELTQMLSKLVASARRAHTSGYSDACDLCAYLKMADELLQQHERL